MFGLIGRLIGFIIGLVVGIFGIFKNALIGNLSVLWNRIQLYFGYFFSGGIYFIFKTVFLVVMLVPFIGLALFEWAFMTVLSIFLHVIIILIGWIPLVGSLVRWLSGVVFKVCRWVFSLFHGILTLPDVIASRI